MKKLLVCITLIFVIIFASCKEKIVPYQLPEPKITEKEQGFLEWEICLKADSYEIAYANKVISLTVNCLFYPDDYHGEIKIKCVGDGKYYVDSPYLIINV